MLTIAARAKADGVVDSIVRYYPPLRKSILKRIAQFAGEEAEMLKAADEMTSRVIQAAWETPYGRSRSAYLSAWPVLEKEALRVSPQDFLNPHVRLRVPAATGGTSGVPLKLWRSLECIVAEQIFIDKLLEPYGFSMRSKVAVLRADSIKSPSIKSPPYGRFSHGHKRLTLSSPHLNPETLGWFHDSISRFEPEVLWVYPSMALNLMQLLERANLKLKVPVILASSEGLSASSHQALQDFFQCRVINYYGQAERVCLAYSTKPGEFYFHPAYGHVELAAPRAVSNSESAVKVIGTNYWNLAMPLVRYDTGDLIYVPKTYGGHELAEIAAGKKPFSDMAGRDGEYLLTRDGMRIIGLNQIPREIEHMFQLQLVQSDLENLTINVLAMPGFTEHDAREIEAHARAKIPPSIAITVQRADKLHTTKRGKTPLVIRHF